MRDIVENGYERVERYCHIIGKNTYVVRRINGDDRMFSCANYDECQKNGGCQNCLCKNCSED